MLITLILVKFIARLSISSVNPEAKIFTTGFVNKRTTPANMTEMIKTKLTNCIVKTLAFSIPLSASILP
jgi:hypothetical protein